MTMRSRLVALAIAGTLCVAGSTAVADSSGATPAPHITATPSSVMVNHTVLLTGSGFTPHARILLQECGVTSWSVPLRACNTANGVYVTPNRNGTFRTEFTVKLCPLSSGPPTRKTCYIGEPKPSGVDTMNLVGAARITVTYP